MSFVEMAPVTATTTTAAALSTSDPAVFTSEEISMIQELFLSGAASALEPLKIVVDDALQVSDISFDVSGGGSALLASLKADELMLGVDDATSVLLSPIGADDSFLGQFLIDEKDAMAAFYTEAIDPFESPSPVKTAPAPASPLHRPSAAGVEAERTLAKLRAKVDALSKMYYSHCQRLQGGAAAASPTVNVAHVKRLQALEKLQRVAAALAAANAQLTTDTSSVREQRAACARDLQSALGDAAHVERILALATDDACAAAMAQATALARDFTVAGDARETLGWSHSSAVSAASDSTTATLAFKCEKVFPTADATDALRQTAETVGSSTALSALLGAHAEVRAVKPLNARAAVVLVDVAQAARVDRTLALVFRAEAGDGRSLLASCSLNPPAGVLDAAPGVGADRVRWAERCVWQLHAPAGERECAVVIGGRCAYASEAEARAMALELVHAVVRWESAVVGPAFRF